MKSEVIILRTVLIVGLLTHSITAHAYLDPGTGSLILQGLLAAIAGALVTANIYWLKLKEIWQKLTSRKIENNQNNENELEQAQSVDAKEKD